jgi:hypothetical protein
MTTGSQPHCFTIKSDIRVVYLIKYQSKFDGFYLNVIARGSAKLIE